MRELNHLINTGDDGDMILHYILSIFAIEASCSELSTGRSANDVKGTIVDSVWKVHVEGFASLVQFYGGVEKLVKIPMTAMAIRHMFMYVQIPIRSFLFISTPLTTEQCPVTPRSPTQQVPQMIKSWASTCSPRKKSCWSTPTRDSLVSRVRL